MSLPPVTNYNLRKHKYPTDVLEANVSKLNITTLLHTQYLTPDFCRKYIMRSTHDTPITHIPYIILCQPHILYCQLDESKLNQKPHLSNLDLDTQQYSIEVLEENAPYLSNFTLVNTQVLTAEFCKKYILDESRMSVEEWYDIDIDYVLRRQPHLTYDDLSDGRVYIPPKPHLTDEDLCKQQYPIDVLEKNQQYLDIRAMVRTQVLTAEFCNKYILDEKYMSVEETYFIDIPYVLQHQPHLREEDLWYPDTEDDSSEEENK